MLRGELPDAYRAFFSSRRGGVSEPPYDTLNLGLLTDDAPESVAENRRRLCVEADCDHARLSYNRQVHGAIAREACENGRQGDAVWTAEPARPLLVFTADCLPVALGRLDGEPAVAAVHVGWRGLLAGVVEEAARALGGGRLAASVGPGIGRCCYEVGEEVAEPFRRRFGKAVVDRGRLDLRSAVDAALRGAGAAFVTHADVCTACSADYFSHRRDGPRTGRQGMVAFVA